MFQAYRKRSNCTRRRRRQMRNSPCPIEKAGLFPLLPCPTVGHFFWPRSRQMQRCGTRPAKIRGQSTSSSDRIRQPTRGFHLSRCRVPHQRGREPRQPPNPQRPGLPSVSSKARHLYVRLPARRSSEGAGCPARHGGSFRCDHQRKTRPGGRVRGNRDLLA
jgi:hypothetical protein